MSAKRSYPRREKGIRARALREGFRAGAQATRDSHEVIVTVNGKTLVRGTIETLFTVALAAGRTPARYCTEVELNPLCR